MDFYWKMNYTNKTLYYCIFTVCFLFTQRDVSNSFAILYLTKQLKVGILKLI